MSANPPFVPTAVYKVKTMVELAEAKPGEKMIDLGSGDGRIPLAFGKEKIESVGVEYNRDLVIKARMKIIDENLQRYVTIKQGDFWNENIQDFDIVVVFAMQSIMKKLEYKIQNEAKKGAKVLSNVFHFQKLKKIKTKNDVHLYIVR